MFYLKSEITNEDGDKIIVCHIHSACCKQDLFFIEDRPNHFINAVTREEVTTGMQESILNARRLGLIWKS